MTKCDCKSCNKKQIKKLIKIPKGYKWSGSEKIDKKDELLLTFTK